jgi:hypothetical protein
MSTKTDLATLGWRVDTTDRLTEAVGDFQAMWNLGTALKVDGDDGPATRAALAVSLARKANGLPDISANFSAAEFRCACGGRDATCRRIWTPRSTVQLAERYRTLVGPFRPERAGRCPTENRRVGGVPNSYHLTGKAIDVPVFKITVAQAHAIGANGVGYYTYGTTRYVRHIDVRPTRVTPWAYPQSTRPAVALTPRPDLATEPQPTTSEEDDMTPAQAAQLTRIEQAVSRIDALDDYISKQVKVTAQLVIDSDADNLKVDDLTAIIPDEMAQQVIDALVARLATTKES